MEELEVMDSSSLRHITGAHVKTPNEVLYRETGVLNIKRSISNQRTVDFQRILKRNYDEITMKVYICQKSNLVKGDWVDHLIKYFNNLEMDMNEVQKLQNT